jgi:hypothetical protein
MSGMPSEKYKRGPCPTCGAVTEIEAEDKCQQTCDQSGEYYCAGQFDKQGFSLVATPESVKAIDDWCSAEAKRQGW